MTQGITDKALLASRMQIQVVACPRCGAAAGERCRNPSGAVTLVPHQARRRAAADAKVYVP